MQSSIELLHNQLDRSVGKKITGERSSALAVASGVHLGAVMMSQSRLSTITAEQGALLQSVVAGDAGVRELLVMREKVKNGEYLSPRNLGVLVDHIRRTGNDIAYRLYDGDGNLRYEVDSALDLVSRFFVAQEAQIKLPSIENSYPEDIHGYLSLALELGFPTSAGSTRYGAVAIDDQGQYFPAGQYSGFDGIGTIHAELAAVYSLVMSGGKVVEIALNSDKYVSTPAQMCGACRQMLVEVAELQGHRPIVRLFSRTGEETVYELTEYLPYSWSPNE